MDRYADEPPAVEVDLETNKVSLPASYGYLDEETQAKIDTKMTVLEEQIARLLAEGQLVDTDLARAIAVAAGLPEPEVNQGDPGSTGAPPPEQPKQVPGPHPGDPPYATGQTPTLAGDPNDVPAMKLDPGSSTTVQRTDNPPGYTGPAGPQRDDAWLAYLSQRDGTTPGSVSRDTFLPNPEAVSNPGLKTVGAAARQQGVSYAWGAGHPDKAPVPGVTTGTTDNDIDNSAHDNHDDGRTGFDCSGLLAVAEDDNDGVTVVDGEFLAVLGQGDVVLGEVTRSWP